MDPNKKIEVFTVLENNYAASEEMQLAFQLFRKSLPEGAQITAVPCENREPALILQQALQERIKQGGLPEFFLIVKSAWIFNGANIQGLVQLLRDNPYYNCILPSDNHGFRSVPVTPYYTQRGFENFTRALYDPHQVLIPYDGRPPFMFLLRSEILAEAGVPDDLFGLPGQLKEKTVISLNDYIHIPVDYYGEARREILDLIPAGVNSLLDIGCATGNFGALLKSGRNCRVTGMELNPLAAAKAQKHLDKVLTGDALTVQPGEKFDCVTCLDSFEHFTYPEKLLARIKNEFLRPQGYFVCSIPNIGQWNIVEDLLAGRWDYIPIGLLCNTHSRFFTFHSFQTLLNDYGFEIIRTEKNKTPMSGTFAKAMETLAQQGMDIDRDNLETHNYHVVAKAVT